MDSFALIDNDGMIREIKKGLYAVPVIPDGWEIINMNDERLRDLGYVMDELAKNTDGKRLIDFCKYPYLHIDDCVENTPRLSIKSRMEANKFIIDYMEYTDSGIIASCELYYMFPVFSQAYVVIRALNMEYMFTNGDHYEFCEIEKVRARCIWYELIRYGFKRKFPL